MRKLLGLATAAALVMGMASSAGAAPASSAFTASISVTLGGLPGFGDTGSGTGTTDTTGAGGTASIPASAFSILTTNPSLVLLTSVITGFAVGAPGQLTMKAPFLPGSNLALSFNGTTGTMGLNASAYLLNPGGKAIVQIPLAVIGAGGTQMFSALAGAVKGTLFANPYQLGMVTLTTTFDTLMPPNVQMATGVDARTAMGGGTLTLVSPTNIVIGGFPGLASIATLVINYTAVPEPGTALLLGAGIAGLAAFNRKRRSN